MSTADETTMFKAARQAGKSHTVEGITRRLVETMLPAASHPVEEVDGVTFASHGAGRRDLDQAQS